MNSNFNFLNSIGEVSEELFKELQNISDFKRIPSNSQIVKLHEVPTKVYLIVSGVVRCYICTESGKEFNKSFYMPTSFMGSLTALVKRAPSAFVFESITDVEAFEVDYYRLMELHKRSNALKSLYSRILEKVYMEYEKRLVDLISLDATGRYLELRKQNPEIDDLISQYHIASYLGITPVQLSRIRKKLGVH
ncbi:Crp/Fnr family transcriptional regulator [Flavobacteriaceae bacterium SZ-1-7]|uniref:Crp/Fnr family transcriptional regulator n=1 Tax=Tamlana sedimenti TaxID=3134126 RepID=UPI003121F32D